jgi:hypothetical protein
MTKEKMLSGVEGIFVVSKIKNEGLGFCLEIACFGYSNHERPFLGRVDRIL